MIALMGIYLLVATPDQVGLKRFDTMAACQQAAAGYQQQYPDAQCIEGATIVSPSLVNRLIQDFQRNLFLGR